MVTYLLNTSANDKVFAYIRKNKWNEVLVVLNFSKENVEFTIEDENVAGVFKNIFDGMKRDFNTEKNFNFKVSDYAVFEK